MLPIIYFQDAATERSVVDLGYLGSEVKLRHVDPLCLKRIPRTEHPYLYLETDLYSRTLLELLFTRVDFVACFLAVTTPDYSICVTLDRKFSDQTLWSIAHYVTQWNIYYISLYTFLHTIIIIIVYRNTRNSTSISSD
jgi:hypothetical protein